MLLSIRGAKFDNPSNRKNFVMFLAATVGGRIDGRFEPYCPNKNDDRYWVFDEANNWRVTFPDGEDTVIDIRYRYQCETVRAEEALAAWLEFQVRATVKPNVEFRAAAKAPDKTNDAGSASAATHSSTVDGEST